MFTCTGVSFAHGSNDGQKGMGLIMLILVGILPSTYALRSDAGSAELAALRKGLESAIVYSNAHATGAVEAQGGNDPASVISLYAREPQSTTPELFRALSVVAGESLQMLEHPRNRSPTYPEKSAAT
jgi:PiT family inorganic phosphate transporter